MTFIDRILAYCADMGLSESAFERGAGISKGLVYKWRTGVSPGLRSQQKVASFMHLSLEELMRVTPEGYEGFATYTFDSDTLRERSALYIPIIDSTTGIIPSSGENGNGKPSERIRILPDSVANPDDCFAMVLYDNSMAPGISAGDVVLVDMSAEIVSGDIVTVSIPGDPVICRKLVRDQDGIILQPFNNAFDAKQFRNSELEFYPVVITGKVVSLIRNYK